MRDQFYISPITLLSSDAAHSVVFFISIAVYCVSFAFIAVLNSRYLSYPSVRMDMGFHIFGWRSYANIAGDENDVKQYPQGMMGAKSILSAGGFEYYGNLSGDIADDENDDKRSLVDSIIEETEYADQQSELYRDFEELMAEPSLQSISTKFNMMLKSSEGLVELTDVVARLEEGEMSATPESRKAPGGPITKEEVDDLMPRATDASPKVERKKSRFETFFRKNR